jgi:8-oxo-dGTP diphosphatase
MRRATCDPLGALRGVRPDDTETMPGPRIPCVGAIITDSHGRLLLIKRGHPPQAGFWSLPGGRIEPGETDQQALVREVHEETGLRVIPGRLVGSVERPGPDGAVLDIRDYAATVTGGDLRPDDDADDARWVGAADLGGLALTSRLAETLTDWGVLDAPPPAALIPEATRRAGLVWLTIPGQDRPCPAWHIWRAEGPPPAGAAYVVTGPGEQPLPGLGDAAQVTVTVASSQTGGRLLSWTADVSRVEPGSADWNDIAGQLAAGRLNARLAPGETSPAQRWARSGAVFRLSPAAD